MLVIFKSKAGGDIIMFEENAKQILDLLNKDTDKGIITAEQTADAIVKLENEIERRKMIEAQEKAERERIEKEEREKKEKKKRKKAKIQRMTEKKKSPGPNLLSVFRHEPIPSCNC